jgi:hypothetical protein
MTRTEKIFTYVVGISSILALFIAIWSIYVTYDSVYGDADIRLVYSKGGAKNEEVSYKENTK